MTQDFAGIARTDPDDPVNPPVNPQRRASIAETVAEIFAAYRSGTAEPAQIVARSYAPDPGVGQFRGVRLAARRGTRANRSPPALRGGDTDCRSTAFRSRSRTISTSVGLATTAACPAFSYRPGRDATAVARLRQAGAIIIGKTNLDQFATGLVGVRSPYGVPRNPLDPD